MTAFDKNGERVEQLAKFTRDELVATRQGALNSLHRWKRAQADREQRLENARRLYEAEIERVEAEANAAPGEIEAHEQWLEELDAQMARMKVKAAPSVWDEAKRQSQVNALVERMKLGGAEAARAAEELKRMLR